MAAPKTDATGKIQRAPEPQQQPKKGEPDSLLTLLSSPGMRRQIAQALPEHLPADRMIRIAMTALRTTRNLALCGSDTFLGCIMQASQLGLEVNTPMQHAFLIPRKNKWLTNKLQRDVYDCTLLIGYQGMIELSRRSGEVLGVRARAVKVGDHFEFEDGLFPQLIHRRSTALDRERAEITYAYAVARFKGDDREFEVLSRAQIEDRRLRSAAAQSEKESPWDTDYEAMACKSAVRALWKWLPKSSEMARAEALEVANDLGKSQIQTLDPEVLESLEKMGLQALDAEAPQEPAKDDKGEAPAKSDNEAPAVAYDKSTGEVIPGQAELPT